MLHKLFTFPTCEFIWNSSFVSLTVRNSNQKVSQSYKLYHRRYWTSKDFDYWLMQYPLALPHLEVIHWLTWYTATCGRSKKVVWVCTRLKSIKKTSCSLLLFSYHSDQFKAKSHLKLIKKIQIIWRWTVSFNTTWFWCVKTNTGAIFMNRPLLMVWWLIS